MGPGGAKDVKVRYTVTDTKMPSALSFDLVTPRGEVVLSGGELPPALNTEHTVSLGTLGPGELEWGSYHLAVCAVDDHGDELNPWQRRDHQDRHMYALIIDQAQRPFDLDMDTDNDSGWGLPGRTAAEESAEPYANPGKLVPVGSSDLDSDAIPDWADGFNRDGGTETNDDDRCTQRRLVPVVLEIPANADPSVAMIRLTYSASDPALVTVTGEGKYAVYGLPAAGKLRLWRGSGSVVRTIADDYLAPGEYSAAELGFGDDQRVRTLYLEACGPSSQPADLRLDAELDFDGAGSEWTYSDGADGQSLTALQLRLGLGPWGGVGTGWPNTSNPGALIRRWRADQTGGGYYDEQLLGVGVTLYPYGLTGTIQVAGTACADKVQGRGGYYGETVTNLPVSWEVGPNQTWPSLLLKGSELSDTMGDIGVSATFTPTVGLGVSDRVRVTVYEPDMIFGGVAEGEEGNGQPRLNHNSDDDNNNGIADYLETGPTEGEDDLVPVYLRTHPALPLGLLHWSPNDPYWSRLRFYYDRVRQYPVTEPLWQLVNGECDVVYAEGIAVSQNEGDAGWSLGYTCGQVSGAHDAVPITVDPMPGLSGAWIRVWREYNATTRVVSNEAHANTGGHVFVAVYVKVGAGERLTPGQSVRARIKDMYDKYDQAYFGGTGQSPVLDQALDLGAGWDWFVGGQWTPASYGPMGWEPMAEPGTFRRLIEWDTMHTPLGNNGQHNVFLVDGSGSAPGVGTGPLALTFDKWTPGGGWGGTYAGGPRARAVETSNVHVPASSVKVSNAKGLDYFKFNPDGELALREPHLDFEVKDGDIHPDRSYRIIVKYRRTGGGGTFGDFETNWWPTEGARTVIKIVGAPGPQTVELTDENPDEPGPLKSWETDWFGTHTFDIWVEKYHGSTQVDSYMLKGPYSLWVPEEEAPDGKPGHGAKWVTDESDGTTKLRAHYWLHDQRLKDASELALVPMDPDLVERDPVRQPTAPLTQGQRYGGGVDTEEGRKQWLPVYTMADDDPGGTWRLLWTGQDSTGPVSTVRRTHDARRMMVANQEAVRRVGLAVLGPKTTSGVPAGSSAAEIASWLRPPRGQIPVPTDHEIDNTNGTHSAGRVMDLWWGKTAADQAPVPARSAYIATISAHGSVGAFEPNGDGRTAHWVIAGGGLLLGGPAGRRVTTMTDFYGGPALLVAPPAYPAFVGEDRPLFADLIGCYTHGAGGARPSMAAQIHALGIRYVVGYTEMVTQKAGFLGFWMDEFYDHLWSSWRGEDAGPDAPLRRKTIREALRLAKLDIAGWSEPNVQPLPGGLVIEATDRHGGYDSAQVVADDGADSALEVPDDGG